MLSKYFFFDLKQKYDTHFSNNRNGVNEPSKKRTRFETDKQRQERLAQEKTRRKEHQVCKIGSIPINLHKFFYLGGDSSDQKAFDGS